MDEHLLPVNNNLRLHNNLQTKLRYDSSFVTHMHISKPYNMEFLVRESRRKREFAVDLTDE